MDFLSDKSPEPAKVIKKLEEYVDLLLKANRRVNLISRQISKEDIWLNHIYDAILPLVYGFDFSQKKVMDLGTGGGLPGIPLAIIQQDAQMHLLDAKQKKTFEISRMIKKLDLNNCLAICNRLEDLSANPITDKKIKTVDYDVIVCRSVAMTKRLLKKAMLLLAEDGFLLLYKAKSIEEALQKPYVEIYNDIDFPEKERKLIKIERYN